MKRKDHPVYKILQDRSDFFCTAKWNELYLYLNHGLSNSCHHPIPHTIPADLLSNPSVLHNTPHKLIQQQLMIDGHRPQECHMCWHIEDLNDEVISDRILKSSIDVDTINDLTVDPNYIPNLIEVVFDNTCNLSCSYCDGGQSSAWATKIKNQPLELGTDYRKLYSNVPIPPGSTKDEYFKAWQAWIPTIKDKIKVIKVSGGEPLLSKNFWDFYNLMPASKQLEFRINSNLAVETRLLDKFISRAEQYKLLMISASIDATGAIAEYSRQGLDYQKFVSNVEYICEHSPDNCFVYLQSTINVFNVFGMTDMFDLSLDLKRRYPNKIKNFYSTIVRFPEFQNISILPNSIKKQLFENISTWYNFNADQLSEKEQISVNKTISYLNSTPKLLKELDSEQLKLDLVKFIKYYDSNSTLKFADIYPAEMVDWINSLADYT